jgi:hypothetical protein
MLWQLMMLQILHLVCCWQGWQGLPLQHRGRQAAPVVPPQQQMDNTSSSSSSSSSSRQIMAMLAVVWDDSRW